MLPTIIDFIRCLSGVLYISFNYTVYVLTITLFLKVLDFWSVSLA